MQLKKLCTKLMNCLRQSSLKRRTENCISRSSNHSGQSGFLDLEARPAFPEVPQHGADVLVATDLDVSGNATASPGASLTSMPRIVSIPCKDSGLGVASKESSTICTECNQIPTTHMPEV
jgi:hypothetical protein